MTDLLTFLDAYEHLRDVLEINLQDVGRTARVLKRAVMEAYRHLTATADWNYFNRVTQVTTETSQTTGTIAYTHSTKLMVLTGATWPASAQFGSVTIGESQYPVSRRIDDTTVELDEVMNPGADIAALATYRWQRYIYLLPQDVTDIVSVVDSANSYQLKRTLVQDVFWRQEIINSDSYPTEWNMFPSTDYPGRWELWLSSASETVRLLRILYNSQFTTLPDFKTTSATATPTSVNITGDVATFSAPTLTSKHVGSVLRISSDTSEPTSLVGAHEDSDAGNIDNPPEFELVITAVSSSTVAILSTPLVPAITSRGYVTSSLIDVASGGMRDYLFRLCEENYQRFTGSDSKRMKTAQEASYMAYRLALVSDSKNHSRPGPRLGWNEGLSIE